MNPLVSGGGKSLLGEGVRLRWGGVFSFFLLHLALGYYDAAVEGDLVIGAGRRYGGVESLRLFS